MRLPSFVHLVRADNPGPMTLEGTNTWLIPDGNSWVVIDPGPLIPRHLDALVEATDGNVSQILLTHGHPDHAEGAEVFATRVGASIRSTDIAHLRGADQLRDGEEVALQQGALTVLHTPGHTGDSTSFLMTNGSEAGLFTGDTILGRGTTVLMPPDGTLADYLSSLDRLEGITSDLHQRGASIALLPGHGPVHADAVSVIAYYINHRQERLDQMRHLIDQGVTSPDDLVREIYADVPDDVKAAALMSVYAQLKFLGETS